MYFRVYCNVKEIEAPDKETAEQMLRDSLNEMKVRFEALRSATLKDLQMDNTGHTFWPKK